MKTRRKLHRDKNEKDYLLSSVFDAEIVASSKSPPELSPIIGGLEIAPEITSAKRTRLEGFALLVESTRLDRDFFLLCDLVDTLGA